MFALRYALPQQAIGHLLQLINVLLPLPSYLPRSYHSFRKAFRDSEKSVKTVLCCSSCKHVINSRASKSNCNFCGNLVNDTLTLENGTFFVTVSLGDQIKHILESTTSELRRNASTDQSMTDVQDSVLYKSCNINDSNDLTLTWNTDGVPLFKSSLRSFWPVRCMINELPYEISRKHMIISSLWFGAGKPNIHAQMTLFVDDIKELNTTGITWKHPVTGITVTSKVFPIISCCDAVARCAVQGIHQYNGTFGCSWCLHEGELVVRGDGYARVYPFVETEKRTHQLVVQHAQQLVSSTASHVLGVKSVSPLILLEEYGFDMVQSFNVEYMHCILLGCVRQFLDLWLNSKNHQSPWYISKKCIGVIDGRLLQIRPPSEITRHPRSITKASTWKASECRAWLLHYSLYALSGNLPRRYLRHWRYLVDAAHYFLTTNLTPQGISNAQNKLNKFVSDVAQLYDIQHVSYNVHQLLHISDSVEHCGPLWRSSAFPFESHNQQLLKLFNGTKYIPQQVSHQLVRINSIQQRLEEVRTNNLKFVHVQALIQQWLLGYPLLKNVTSMAMGTVAIGRPHTRPISAVEKRLTGLLCHFPVPDNCSYYNRAIIHGKPFCVESYGKKFRNNNYTVELANAVIANLESFICFHDNNMLIIARLYEEIPVTRDWASHMKLVSLTDTVVSLRPNDIVRKCVNVGQTNSMHILMSMQPKFL